MRTCLESNVWRNESTAESPTASTTVDDINNTITSAEFDGFQKAERHLQNASDTAADLWSVMHNDPYNSKNSKPVNATEEYIVYRDRVERLMNRAASVFEQIGDSIDNCTQVRKQSRCFLFRLAFPQSGCVDKRSPKLSLLFLVVCHHVAVARVLILVFVSSSFCHENFYPGCGT